MNISAKSLEIIDSCRFCWMCHHICPVGNATGQERNTARGRALILSLVARDSIELNSDVINNMYECTLCGGCTETCVTGWDPIVYTKEARTEAALEGMLPVYIEKMLDNMEQYGNVYGEKELDSSLSKKIANQEKDSNTLLFLGMDARYKMSECAEDAIDVMIKSGADFTMIKDEPNSGWALDTIIGAAEETRQAMKKTAEILNNYKKIVVFDPADAKIFIREYKEYGIDLTSEIITFTSFCAEKIKDGSLKVKKSDMKLAFQDPALLVREVGEFDEPRAILSACGEIKEMMLNGKATMFAGNLLMAEYLLDTMKLIAKARWKNALDSGAEALVTASVSEYAILKMVKPDNIKLISIEQLINGEF